MVGHWGYCEIFRSPMVMAAHINKVSTTTMHVLLRQHTRRKNDPITRQFCFSFGCIAMVEAFVFAHNCFIIGVKEMKESAVIDEAAVEEVASEVEDEEDDSGNHQNNESKEEESIGEKESEEYAGVELDEEARHQLGWLEEVQNTQDPFADYIPY